MLRPVLAALALLLAPAPALAQLTFTPAEKLAGSAGGTEPRAAVQANDHRYVITNAESGGAANLYVSADRGRTWTIPGDPFPGQTSATIDVDVTTMTGGRLLATELDSAGLTFPSAVSDDEGRTWKESSGSNELADQDRQWVATGPIDPETGKHRVYMVWHNLLSGSGVHNVFVATSTDGGETFGPPVPVTVPGDQAFSDLQCAAGYPSSMSVDQKTGQIYVFFISRASGVAAAELGGCGASVVGPFEVNIIHATRVWVATSMDGSAGSWTQSLAVDRTATGNIVAMQFAPGTLDNQGNPWVVFTESPNPYPDYSGAALKVVRSDPSMAKWSEPVTMVPAGGAGAILPHIAVGDPGKVSVAYYKGEGSGEETAWRLHLATTHDALSARPQVSDQQLADVVNYKGTASSLMGACSDPGPTQGIQNGLTCSRAPDNFGLAMDADCRLTITWPAEVDDAAGTWVTTQTGGPGLCGTAVQREGAGSAAPVGPFCRDLSAPAVTRSRRGVRATRRSLRIAGTTRDRGCEGQTPDRPVAGNVARVEVAVARLSGRRCAFLARSLRPGRAGRCDRARWLAATGTDRWAIQLRGRLRRGTYGFFVRARDRAGNESPLRRAIRFRVR